MSDAFATPGAFSWTELLTTDVAGAKTFYTELFGWELEEMDMGDTHYTVVKVGGQPVGGMMAMPEQDAGAPPHWGGYVTVSDVDAKAEQVVKLGGKILVPAMDIPTVGRMCVIQDPQGAAISIIAYADREC